MSMWNATLDMAGLYAMDNTIFDGFVFPTATVEVDLNNDGTNETYNLSLTDEEKTNIIDMILFNSEHLCVRYTDPDVFKNRLAIYSKHMSLDDWSKALYYSFFCRTFNPTENVFEFTNEKTKRQNGRTLTYDYSNYKEISEQTADGKNYMSFDDYVETDEQKSDGKNDTSFIGYVETDEQKSDGKNYTTFDGYVEADEQKTNAVKENHGAKVHAKGSMDSNVNDTINQSSADGYGTVSGSLPVESADTYNDKTTDSIGKVEHSKAGTIKIDLSDGKVEHSKDGQIKVATGIGKVEHTRDGQIKTDISQGKIEKSITGSKSEVETFAITPDIFDRIRHGNIGVTMSGEIIKNTYETEKMLDVQGMIINDIIGKLALAVF